MFLPRASAVAALLLLAAPLFFAQSPAKPLSDGAISDAIGKLRSVPDTQRGARTAELAQAIRGLPAGQRKLQLADNLAHLSTEGDPGQANLQEVATTLAQALKESPVPEKKGVPSEPYVELAMLVRYEGMTADIDDPQFKQAAEILATHDAEISKADFTLSDIHGKKVTLSELHGKIVVVNFWATWCPPCRKELPDLEAIVSYFKAQGVVVLAITDETAFKVNQLFDTSHTNLTMLFDPEHKVAKAYHVGGIPRTFVFDREGQLVAQSMDMRTQRQFLAMLQRAGLKQQN